MIETRRELHDVRRLRRGRCHPDGTEAEAERGESAQGGDQTAAHQQRATEIVLRTLTIAGAVHRITNPSPSAVSISVPSG